VDYDENSKTFGCPKNQRKLGDHEWLYNIITICGEVGLSMQYLVVYDQQLILHFISCFSTKFKIGFRRLNFVDEDSNQH